MKIEERESPRWSEPGHHIACRVNRESFQEGGGEPIDLKLRVDDVLERFEGRQVLVASAKAVESEEVSTGLHQAIMHPTYLIEESIGERSARRDWPQELDEWVRSPVGVEVDGEVSRSIFVDNVGVSVGDLSDLLRGRLNLIQIEEVFEAVAQLFHELHAEGWVHLGLTPWNIRIYQPDTSDGFPHRFLSTEHVQEGRTSAEKGGGFVRDDKTVVEATPLGEREEEETIEALMSAGPAGEDSHTDGVADASTTFPEQPQWDDLSGETSAASEAAETSPEEPVSAILDGIDRLYPQGPVDDEIAVTPGFSAPELLSGMGTEEGVPADIFSLGMFLYFLVAGVVPPASVYTRYGPAIPARNFRPAFAPGLQSVIARATRPRPTERYESVEAMMEAFKEACRNMHQREARAGEAGPSMVVESDTHVGIAKRRRNPTNQDSVYSARSPDGKFALVVVADGVSTASYGSGDLASTELERATRAVWDDALKTYQTDGDVDEVAIIRTILNDANEGIVDYVNDHHRPFMGSPHEVMGSTALVAVICDGTVTLASLGDSRVYLQRGASMEQITIDHNLWTLSILEGVAADRALSMPHGDALARCLGTFVIDDGHLESVEPQPDLFRFTVMEEDTLLLTTDGLVDFAGTNLHAAEDNILSVLLSEPSPALACLELILLANRGGGGDNIGLAVVRF